MIPEAGWLTLFTIYKQPKDYPKYFAVRKSTVVGGNIIVGKCDLANTLEEARLLLPLGLFNMGRHDSDDQVIVEVWV